MGSAAYSLPECKLHNLSLKPATFHAQDPAARIVKLARALEEECPQSLKGIRVLSKVDIAHAEERLHSLIRQWKLTVSVPFVYCSKLLLSATKVHLQQPMVLPMSWFSYLLNQHPGLLVGGLPLQESKRMLEAFWQAYRTDQPT